MSKLTEQYSFLQLKSHHQRISQERIGDWFQHDPKRFNDFSLRMDDFFLDYSKNHITRETMGLLYQLAEENQLRDHIASLFALEPINSTEDRPVLHTALRDKFNLKHDMRHELQKLIHFATLLREKKWHGVTGKPITDIINIGIGGSHLGPMMAIHALKPYCISSLHCHFLSNCDEAEVEDVLSHLNPETTLCIISSKTFTTLETLNNAKRLRAWFHQKLGEIDFKNHWAAVTCAPFKAEEFGILPSQIFTFWEGVGGRYSIWSAIGLPLLIMIGRENFQAFLDGAFAMDCHFREMPFEKNMPVILGLLGIWYINFFHAHHQAIIPYSYRLQYFPEYLQQLDMESNGKMTHKQEGKIQYATGPIIFGKLGCDSQHSFFQLMHQGNHYIPIDFIATGDFAQDTLTASAIAQAQAFMLGKSHKEAIDACLKKGYSQEKAAWLAEHQTLPGNKPSNFLFIRTLSPFNLGALLALYEHKIFVQGIIWGINSFDQWGVELGKQLLPLIIEELAHPSSHKLDASTHGLIQHYLSMKETQSA